MRKIILPLDLAFWIVPLVAIVPLVVISIFVELPIGNSAHFGGLIIGLIYGFYLKRKFKNKTKNLIRYIN
jgi:membrane associated rhomboid family serine protease